MRPSQDSVLMDLGAGTGFFASRLSERTAAVVCVDISQDMLSRIREKTASRPSNLLLVQGDILALPFSSGIVDHVLAAFVYHEVSDRARLMSETARVLRPGGKLTVVDFRKRLSFEGPPLWVKKSARNVETTASPWFSKSSIYESRVYYQIEFVKKG